MLSSWIGPVAVAPLIGSFLSALVARAENPPSLVWGRSKCTTCGHQLGVRDLIPIVSWLALRGRCRYCAQPIAGFYPAIEIAALGIAAWAAFAAPDRLVWSTCILGWALLGLALVDFRYYLLPDFLTVPLIIGGLVENELFQREDIVSCLIGAIAGYLFVVLLRLAYRLCRGREAIGLGDAKMLAAAGAWLTWQTLPNVVLMSTLFALLSVLPQHFRRESRLSLSDRVPFGTFLCIAVWLEWLYGPFPFAP